jgi:hypothetical protein
LRWHGRPGDRSSDIASHAAVVPYQMQPGDEKVVAERLFALLSKPPKAAAPSAPWCAAISVAGQWGRTILDITGANRRDAAGGSLRVGDHPDTIIRCVVVAVSLATDTDCFVALHNYRWQLLF